MAFVLKDRVRDTTTTTGTGTVTLAGAPPTGFQAFSAIGNGNTTYYTIALGSEWETGIGTYTSAGTTLARTTVLASSNGGSAVNFSAGTKEVFCCLPADRGGQEGTYTPTITALSGTITTASATGLYVRVGQMVTVWIDITITTNGTGAGAIIATLPFTSRNTTQSYSGSGYQNSGTTNTALSVACSPNAANIGIEKYDGTYPGANSTRFYVTLTYPI